MFYSEEDLMKLRDLFDLKTEIEQFTALKKVGEANKMIGDCPICQSEQSLIVDPAKQNFYCVSCGNGGDVFSFYMKKNNQSLQTVLNELDHKREQTKVKNEKLMDRIYQMNEIAAGIFASNLNGAIRYIQERQISDDMISTFRIGYAVPYKDLVTKTLLKRGFTRDEILLSGLVKEKDEEIVDKFKDRLMFPIFDQDGRIIAFGGRLVEKNEKRPKYLNSPATPAFDKSIRLFAINLAKNSKQDFFILTEGFMDTIALHQAGFDNAIAGLGTALTRWQADLISKYKKKVYLCYDSDEPGQKATAKAFSFLKPYGVECKVIEIKGAKDPDELIKKFGRKKFEEAIEKSKTEDEWRYSYAVQEWNPKILENEKEERR